MLRFRTYKWSHRGTRLSSGENRLSSSEGLEYFTPTYSLHTKLSWGRQTRMIKPKPLSFLTWILVKGQELDQAVRPLLDLPLTKYLQLHLYPNINITKYTCIYIVNYPRFLLNIYLFLSWSFCLFLLPLETEPPSPISSTLLLLLFFSVSVPITNAT